MSNTFQVSVNDDFEFQLQPEDVNNLDTSALPDNKQHILINHQSASVSIEAANALKRQYTILINGNRYKVSIKNELDKLIADMGLGLGEDAVEDDIFAPMPGAILSVDVAVGDSVKQGDTLCVLEAMKMENALLAPRDGTIATVEITKGNTVEKNVLLMTLEPLQ